MANKKQNNQTTEKKATEKTTADYIKEFEKENINGYPIFNSNKALKTGLKIVFNDFEIIASKSEDLNFNLTCKIKTEDFAKLNTNNMFDISSILKMQLNLFENVYKQKFLNVLKDIDQQTQKYLLSKAICYTLNTGKTLKNSLKWYKENNITPTIDDLLTKQKLSIYQVLKEYVYMVYDFINATKPKTDN